MLLMSAWVLTAMGGVESTFLVRRRFGTGCSKGESEATGIGGRELLRRRLGLDIAATRPSAATKLASIRSENGAAALG